MPATFDRGTGARSKRPDYVPNAGLRDAFLRSGMSAGSVALAIGLKRNRRLASGNGTIVCGDDSRLKRALGLKPYHKRLKDGTRDTYIDVHLPEERALAIMHVLGLDPVDVGL